MKKIALLLVFLMSTLAFSQTIEPKLEIVNNKVKATYYNDNGTVQQEGFFKDGKLDGKWTSYDANGSVQVIAYYENGVKSGKWMYFTSTKSINEVVYAANKVVSTNTLQKEALANKY